jgi:hypothetical protein
MSRITQSRHDDASDSSRAGALSGIGSGALVLTLRGETKIEDLVAGDRIITRSGARTLKRITAHVVRGACIVRPHTLGHDRPEVELTLAPGQKLLLRDWRARALYARDQAHVPATRLVDGAYIAASDAPARLWRLAFDAEEVIYAGGLELTIPAPDAADI